MAFDGLVTVPAGNTWTELTDGENASGAVSIQNRGSGQIIVTATATGTAPLATVVAGWIYTAGEADARTLADMFPGLTTPVRLWARSASECDVMVSYA